MKPGQESQTAIMVAKARAIADGRTKAKAFHDPTAFALLPPEAQREVEAVRSGQAVTAAAKLERRLAERRGDVMAARTVAIDAAVREAAAPQVVILGAGLDGRAWRIPELGDVTVYEVDHPDSQRQKRARASALTLAAREVRFVPVDFTVDDLDHALEAAGHQVGERTTWIWEGVVMYLTIQAIEQTLRIMRARSVARSRLIILYHAPALMLAIVGWVVKRVGEPLRSAFRPASMRALLARHGFHVISDGDLPTHAAQTTPEIADRVRPMRHLRIAIAERE